MRKTLTRLLLAGLAIAALSGCDPRAWPQRLPRGEGQTHEHELICAHYWPDGHTGCQP